MSPAVPVYGHWSCTTRDGFEDGDTRRCRDWPTPMHAQLSDTPYQLHLVWSPLLRAAHTAAVARYGSEVAVDDGLALAVRRADA
jgi:hypothetical protein